MAMLTMTIESSFDLGRLPRNFCIVAFCGNDADHFSPMTSFAWIFWPELVEIANLAVL